MPAELPVVRFGRIISRVEKYSSKSGGKLRVLIQLNAKTFDRFLSEQRKLRIYKVTDIPKGGVGAREFHRQRSEIITVERGAINLQLEDLAGRKKAIILREGVSYGLISPYILHTYTALSDCTSMVVVANTLYDHRNPSTYDSYPENEFRKLQTRSRKK